jgi:hypothetical protein
MPDIGRSIQIGAAPHLVHPLVASGEGFSRWWASDVTEEKTTENFVSNGLAYLASNNKRRRFRIATYSIHRHESLLSRMLLSTVAKYSSP